MAQPDYANVVYFFYELLRNASLHLTATLWTIKAIDPNPMHAETE